MELKTKFINILCNEGDLWEKFVNEGDLETWLRGRLVQNEEVINAVNEKKKNKEKNKTRLFVYYIFHVLNTCKVSRCQDYITN